VGCWGLDLREIHPGGPHRVRNKRKSGRETSVYFTTLVLFFEHLCSEPDRLESAGSVEGCISSSSNMESPKCVVLRGFEMAKVLLDWRLSSCVIYALTVSPKCISILRHFFGHFCACAGVCPGSTNQSIVMSSIRSQSSNAPIIAKSRVISDSFTALIFNCSTIYPPARDIP